MRIENQVCSLPLAKRLKELNVPQESYFAWAEVCTGTDPMTHKNIWDYRVVKNDFQANNEFISAFSVAELLKLSGEKFLLLRQTLSETDTKRWEAGSYWNKATFQCYGPTPTDALGELIIKLYENA